MKKLFAIAILASAFTFTSCGNKTAENTTAATTTTTPAANTTTTPVAAEADNSLSGRAATTLCNCPAMKELSELGKEIEANKDNKEKAMELTGKMMTIMPKMKECTKDLDAEIEKAQAAGGSKEAFQTEMQGKMMKMCPDLLPKK